MPTTVNCIVFQSLDTIFFSNFIIIPGLLDLANAYCEEALKRHCERIIRHGITTENAAMLYAVAIKYEATVSKALVSDFRALG